MSRWGSRLLTAVTMGPANQALVLEAAATLLVVRIRLARLPFGAIVSRLGRFMPPDAEISPMAIGPEGRRTIARVRWAISVAAPLVPFRAVCLQRTLAGCAMLERRNVPAILHFGGRLNDGAVTGEHAWLTAYGIGVAGFPIDPGTVEIGRIVPTAWAATSSAGLPMARPIVSCHPSTPHQPD